jgi:zinc ribbon protein
MSSETSTEPQPAFEPWQLFTLAGLIGATIAVFMARGESAAAVIMISLTIFAAAGVGIAALRTFLPLTQKSATFGPRLLGGRTRAALDREKTLVLRSIKELEFDRAMGKVSEKDFADMSGRLRSRAARLMRQLDAGAGYRGEIEKEITKRIGEAPVVSASGGATEPASVAGTCASCGTSNDVDARFCKHCGHSLEARS